VLKGKCGVCVKFCPVENCINLDEKDETVELNVGNIIVATGFQTFDPKRAEQYGYGKFPNVVTSLEFERLVNAAGPTQGNIRFRTQDKKGNWIFEEEGEDPKSVAIVHCIGSRDHNHNKYCSRVCCMYSLKLAHLIKEKIPNAAVYEYYIDMRAFGKGYEEFSERIKEEGVHMIRGRTAKVEQSGDQLMVRSEEIYEERILEQNVDMVVLSVGLEARADAGKVAKMLGIEQGEDGWFVENNYLSEPTSTFTGGITIAGVCQGPKDIPDTVAQASAAASRVLQTVIKGKIRGGIKDMSPDKIIENARQISPLKMEVES
jgi:heterodisulfide reductase subunit A